MSILLVLLEGFSKFNKIHFAWKFAAVVGLTQPIWVCLYSEACNESQYRGPFSLLQWLPEQMECGNLQIGKQAVALWIPMTQKWLIPHLKALNVGFNFRYQTLQKL